jgi:hypothetical protein
MSQLLIRAANYSLFVKKPLLTKIEAIIYSLGLSIEVAIDIQVTIQTVFLYDFYQDGEFQKDMLLLVTATSITEGVFVLDLIGKGYKSHINKNEKPSIEKELANTNDI